VLHFDQQYSYKENVQTHEGWKTLCLNDCKNENRSNVIAKLFARLAINLKIFFNDFIFRRNWEKFSISIDDMTHQLVEK
jgi:hypothetical protein